MLSPMLRRRHSPLFPRHCCVIACHRPPDLLLSRLASLTSSLPACLERRKVCEREKERRKGEERKERG
jgi:hypothetical protein